MRVVIISQKNIQKNLPLIKIALIIVAGYTVQLIIIQGLPIRIGFIKVVFFSKIDQPFKTIKHF